MYYLCYELSILVGFLSLISYGVIRYAAENPRMPKLLTFDFQNKFLFITVETISSARHIWSLHLSFLVVWCCNAHALFLLYNLQFCQHNGPSVYLHSQFTQWRRQVVVWPTIRFSHGCHNIGWCGYANPNTSCKRIFC